ncbi:MAG: glycosyltransferase family 4 protein [Chlamydiae bacterium]|nr:glycosyltransferase family 4 protein [Chlamydiota bacterium]MBI3277320.1 glycosyltransferase family 4 protein [Chlamydiota bacterium]
MNLLNPQSAIRNPQSFKIAFVIPRYEIGTAGGAEIHAAELAHRLAQRGHKIEVFTTCAQDHHLWENVMREGEEEIKGVRVHRLSADTRENILLFSHLQRKMHLNMPLSQEEELAWLKNSVHSEKLYQTLEERTPSFDGVIFMPYLFGITFEGSRHVADKFILIPCLHDEPFAKLSITKEMFERARFIFFNTQPESELAQRLYLLNSDRLALVALGFDEYSQPSGELAFRQRYGLGDAPYFIYVGRWEKGKNVDLLIHYFRQYFLSRNERKLKFVLLGSGDVEIPDAFSENILPLGYISVEDKWNAIRGATALCQPSLNESLSIVIMEAWSFKTPVLVHENCAVTKHHCVQSGGGLYFSNYFEFEEAIDFFLDHDSLRRLMGERGYQYVREHYSWEKVLDRFETAFEAYLKGRAIKQ